MAHVAVPDEPLPEATEALGDPSKSTADDGTPVRIGGSEICAA
jgi:hypothetical protein